MLYLILLLSILFPLSVLGAWLTVVGKYKRERKSSIIKLLKLEIESSKLSIAVQALNENREVRSQQMSNFKRNVEKRYRLLEYVRGDFERLKKDHPNNVRLRLIELNGRINETVDERLEDWKNFEQIFDSVYPHYLQNFSMVFPELTDGEIRLCALLKLNLETKQIASILNLTSEGVKVAKYRLRKKLRLTTDENLIVFFNSI